MRNTVLAPPTGADSPQRGGMWPRGWRSVEALGNLRWPPTSRVGHKSTGRSLAGLHALCQTSRPAIGGTSYRKARL